MGIADGAYWPYRGRKQYGWDGGNGVFQLDGDGLPEAGKQDDPAYVAKLRDAELRKRQEGGLFGNKGRRA